MQGWCFNDYCLPIVAVTSLELNGSVPAFCVPHGSHHAVVLPTDPRSIPCVSLRSYQHPLLMLVLHLCQSHSDGSRRGRRIRCKLRRVIYMLTHPKPETLPSR